MRTWTDLIHSPLSLFVFEAAARHLSFTGAARELQVSQPAVSQAVRKIEDALGTRLFHRHHRSVSLTEAGERFYHDVSLSLMRIKQAAEHMALHREPDHATLRVSPAFAGYWLVPRLPGFRRRHPGLDLRIETTDREIEADPTRSGDLSVRRGLGEWPGCEAFRLAPEAIIPVASPAFIEHHPYPINPQSLVGFDLIHLQQPSRAQPAWADWFAFHGLTYEDPGHGPRFEEYSLVLQAAMAGEGIALGWRHLVDPLIEKGLLAGVLDATYRGEEAFWVIWRGDAMLGPAALAVLDWLRAEVVQHF